MIRSRLSRRNGEIIGKKPNCEWIPCYILPILGPVTARSGGPLKNSGESVSRPNFIEVTLFNRMSIHALSKPNIKDAYGNEFT